MTAPAQYDYLPTPVLPRLPPQKLLLGQKALVTGASSGIGRAVALCLGEAGADVVVNFISDADKAQELVEEIKSKGSNSIAIRADVSDESQVESMFQQMIAGFGRIDILVNNAGLQQDARLQEMTLAQ
jgi:glucose 1-dehydrogenase